MISVNLQLDVKRLHDQLDELQRKQLPFITVQAVNATAKAAVADIRKSMTETFNDPVPWTLNSVYAKTAHTRQANPTAWVGVKEYAPGGTPAVKYLAPEAFGGERGQKRFEKAIAYAVPDAPAFTVPGSGAKLDDAGNLQRGQLNQLLSGLGAFGEEGYTANATTVSARRKKRLVHKASFRGASSFFIAKSKASGRPLGVFQVVGKGKVAPVLLFTDKAPTYKPNWPMAEIVAKSVEKNRERLFWAAFHQAMATAK